MVYKRVKEGALTGQGMAEKGSMRVEERAT